MPVPRIRQIEAATLIAERPRYAGKNARLGDHGRTVRVPIVRLTTDDGAQGFGWCRLAQDALVPLVGMPLDAVFLAESGPIEAWQGCEFPLWDLMGQRTGLPVYALAAQVVGHVPPAVLRVPCYDTSLYLDDMHLTDDQAVSLIADEARQGYERGHRAFKLKVGRGARWMPLEAGTARDIAVIHGVRAAVGLDAPLMIDANNGYNLNLTKRVLAETADCHLYWIEEPFHEDAVLYRDLKDWLAERDMPVRIADGEGAAAPALIEWAHGGVVDVVQYDIFTYGFTRWLTLGADLDGWRVRSAPHHYGGLYGNYAAGHLAAAISGFAMVEWDDAITPAIDASPYRLCAGQVELPAVPGFGLTLDEGYFNAAVKETGFVIT